MTTAYPPHRFHSSTSIPPTHALTLLSAYLSATATDPSLHPNALHTDNGPIAPSAGANTGLVLHNLRRVEAGLRGEQLGPDLKGQGDEGGADEGGTVVGMPSEGELSGQKDVEMDGWQDKEEYEREQYVVQGDIGERDNGVDGGFEREAGQVPKIKASKVRKDVDCRKKAKKERRLEERQKRADCLKRLKNAED